MRKLANSLCCVLVPVAVAVLGVAGGGTQAPAPAPRGDPNPVVFGPGRLVPIGGGRSLYLKCQGRGTPTFILAGGTADAWMEVQDTLSRTTQTCAYDQAGLGYSLPGPGRTEADQVADLQRLLHHAKLPAPYVLVGGSSGRRLVRLYARAHPNLTRGVVVAAASEQPRIVAAAVKLAARTGR